MTEPITIRREGGFGWRAPHSRRELAAALAAMREACGLSNVALELVLAGDAFVSRVNAEQMGCIGPTNILSFPPFAGAGASSGVGILLLSLDTLRREAFLYGQDAGEHALRLLAHGMAHLTGADHGEELDAVQEKAFAAGRRAFEGE